MVSYLPTTKQGFAQFFMSVQEAPWYAHFLDPVLEELKPFSPGSKLLDVGTGPGKFIELVQDSFDLECIGVDIDETMLIQARKRRSLANVPLIQVEPNQALPFGDESFDAITFCSVLFLLDDPYFLLTEAFRLLRNGGKIIVLTPTGNGTMKEGLSHLSTLGLNNQRWTFAIWKKGTAKKAQDWGRANILKNYAKKNHISYNKCVGFGGYAVAETLHKISH